MKDKNKNSKESSLNNAQHGGDENKKKTKTNSSKRRVGVRLEAECSRCQFSFFFCHSFLSSVMLNAELTIYAQGIEYIEMHQSVCHTRSTLSSVCSFAISLSFIRITDSGDF